MVLHRFCLKTSILSFLVLAGGFLCLTSTGLWGAQNISEEMITKLQVQLDQQKVMVDTVWVLIAGMLVFFMNTGFGMLETGLTRAKNCVNILAKNFNVFAIASLAFWIIGWGLMFGDGNVYFGTEGLWYLSGADNSPASPGAYEGVYSAIAWAQIPLWAKFFFQLVFAATAATIVSGVVAERVKYESFLVFSFLLVGILYPVTGHWIWGGGWLAQNGFWDFAGSTVVHSVGGWAALAGVLLLGPRIGKYREDGTVKPIMGHNLTAAMLGTFILWLGWFGFNPGSTLSADPQAIAHIAVTTNMSAAAGALAATVTAWFFLGYPDLTMILNGAIGGLVAITAPCAWVSTGGAVVIGLVAGFLVVLSVIGFDRVQIDDPVGALSAHLTNGIWGTLSVGLFAAPAFAGGSGQPPLGLFYSGDIRLLMTQLFGVIMVGVFAFFTSLGVWAVIKGLMGIRVSREEELRGLDLTEHDQEAYAGFQIFLTE